MLVQNVRMHHMEHLEIPDKNISLSFHIFQIAVFTVETVMEGACCLYPGLHDDLHGVQDLPLPGTAGPGGEANKVVQVPEHW